MRAGTLKYFLIGVVMALCGALTCYACSPNVTEASHGPLIVKVDESQVYEADEAVEGLASSEKTGEICLVTIANPVAKASTSLFPEVDKPQLAEYADDSFNDFRQKQFGYTIGPEGALTSGFSYVLVSLDYRNDNDVSVSVGLNSNGFYLWSDDGNLTPCQSSDPVWVSGRDGHLTKDFFILHLGPGDSAKRTLLYVVSDEALADPSLLYVADEGISSSGTLEGMKAYRLSIQKG
ncbi:MAG: hypothetical protein LBG81_02780 [Coriobacteriaceae bacterium]|nr:hypothetical protein [Coriobacteriaceae bacterium]